MNQPPTPPQPVSSQEVAAKARHVTFVGMISNIVLSALKIAAGIVGRSSAMIADGIHSVSDVATDAVVFIFIKLSMRDADADHQYGHGKYETFATLLISAGLGIVGLLFFIDGAEKIYAALHDGIVPERPRAVAIVMAIVSVAAKEWMYRYTLHTGKRINSPMIVANAWHHRSDALSSLATLLGIAGAMFLGTKWRILDPAAAMVVSVFIIIVGVQLARPAVAELLEASLPKPLVGNMVHTIETTPGVLAFHHFMSRRNGNRMFVDLHIKVDPHITVSEGHEIATELENRLKRLDSTRMTVNIHVEPYEGEKPDNIFGT